MYFCGINTILIYGIFLRILVATIDKNQPSTNPQIICIYTDVIPAFNIIILNILQIGACNMYIPKLSLPYLEK